MGCGCDGSVPGTGGACSPCGGVQRPVGPPGQNGLSAYQLAVDAGFSGSYNDWALTLIGPAGPPGDPGSPGAPGNPGAQGANRWTLLTASFPQPAVYGTVTITVQSTAGFAEGEWYYIVGGGYYALQTISSLTQAVMINTGVWLNAAPGATVLLTGLVGPSGVTGLGWGPPIAGVPVGNPPSGVVFVLNTLTGGVYYWNGSAWVLTMNLTGPVGPVGPVGPLGPVGLPGVDGIDGSQALYGPADPNTLAPTYGAVGDVYRRYTSLGGVLIDEWQRTAPGASGWTLQAAFPSSSASLVQTFRATKTDNQNIPNGVAVDVLVNVENDSTGGNSDAGATWSGSQWTAAAAVPNCRFTLENLVIMRPSGTQVITFTVAIVRRPFGGADTTIGSTTLAFTGATPNLTAGILMSSTVNMGVGDTVRLKVTSPTSPTDGFQIEDACIFYNQEL